MTLGSRTFISFDDADGLGVRAQVNVTTGSLPVKFVGKPGTGVVKVEFDHTAADLKYPISANVLESEPFMEALRNSASTGEPVSFRLETQRKNDIDRRLAFPPASEADRAEGARYLTTQGTKENEVVKKLVMVNGEAGSELRTDPAEDHKWSNVPRSQVPAYLEVDQNAPTAGGSGAGVNVENLAAALKAMAETGGHSPVLVGPLAALAISTGADPKGIEALVDKATRVNGSNGGRGQLREAQAWYTSNMDGSRNYGSYEVGAALGVLEWTEKYLARVFAEYAANGGTAAIDPSPLAEGRLTQVKTLAAGLLKAADAVQAAAYGTGVSDRAVGSHAKARGVVYHVVEHVMPFSFAEAVIGNRRQEWFDLLVELATERFLAAVDVLDNTDDLLSGLAVTVGVAPSQETAAPSAAVEDVVEDVVEAPPVNEPVAQDENVTVEQAAVTDTRLEDAMAELDAAPILPFLVPDLGPMDKDELDGQAPSDEDVAALAKLMELAKVDKMDVVRWINDLFHVDSPRDVHGPRLNAMLSYYRSFGVDGIEKFRQDVSAA